MPTNLIVEDLPSVHDSLACAREHLIPCLEMLAPLEPALCCVAHEREPFLAVDPVEPYSLARAGELLTESKSWLGEKDHVTFLVEESERTNLAFALRLSDPCRKYLLIGLLQPGATNAERFLELA